MIFYQYGYMHCFDFTLFTMLPCDTYYAALCYLLCYPLDPYYAVPTLLHFEFACYYTLLSSCFVIM